MKMHMKQGWRLAVKHMNIIILLFLYQLLWGFFLYRFVDSVVTPLLRRFPGDALPPSAVRLFFSEAQFQLMKTDLIHPYLWMFGGLFLARMLLTPLFNAGLFYSLHHATDESGTKFIEGIRSTWKPVMLLYWVKTLLALAPAWWLLPAGLQALLKSGTMGSLLQTVLPGAAAWLLWSVLLHLLVLSMQFGAASGSGVFNTLWHAVRHIAPFTGVSLLMWAIGIGIALCVTSVSLIWAGLFALILHQGYHLIRTMMKVWTICAQYDCLQSRTQE